MNNERDAFKKGAVTVGGGSKDGDVWAPGFDDQKMPRFQATDNDFRIGHYIEHKENIGKNGSEVHVFQTSTGEKFQLWGTTVLDDKLKQVRDNYGLGTAVCIEWKGRIINKAMKKAYEETPEAHRAIKFPWNTSFWQAWEVTVNTDIPKVAVQGYAAAPTNNAPAPTQTPAPAAAMPQSLDFEDDLPI